MSELWHDSGVIDDEPSLWPGERTGYSGMVTCACGDSYPSGGYGAGFMAANNGVCENCDMERDDMIMISSKAGQRLARAQHIIDSLPPDEYADPHDPRTGEIFDEWVEASTEVAKDLIAGRHHEAEGE